MKRYAIVMVDYKCPVMLEEKLKVCLSGHSCYHTEKCPYQWGDTKWQLVMKVAQVLLREKLEWYREHLNIIPKGKIDEPLVRILYEHCLNKAKKIIEFLGVE